MWCVGVLGNFVLGGSVVTVKPLGLGIICGVGYWSSNLVITIPSSKASAGHRKYSGAMSLAQWRYIASRDDIVLVNSYR